MLGVIGNREQHEARNTAAASHHPVSSRITAPVVRGERCCFSLDASLRAYRLRNGDDVGWISQRRTT